jgi:hypothetical protein
MIGMEKVDKNRHKTTGIVDAKRPGSGKLPGYTLCL